jgi:[protein-PII] uridylyltransferase
MRAESRSVIEVLGKQRVALIRELESRPSGLTWCQEHSDLADEVVLILYHDLFNGEVDEPPLAVIATGGFGRRELCPFSDIDITVVPLDEKSPELDDVIRTLFQDLHWAFGTALRLEVGWAYRLVSDAHGLDAKTRTGLLDMRLIAGSPELFRKLDHALAKSFPGGEFILAKTEERQAMYERHHDSPYVAEPHLKEGAGGLRDFHCANWIAEAIGERALKPTEAYDTVVKYRNLLHMVSGRMQDVFNRSRQEEIAKLLRTSTDRLISDLIRAGAELHGGFVRAKEKIHEARFRLSDAALSVGGEVRVLPVSSAGQAAVGIAIAVKLGLRVSDLPVAAESAAGGPPAAYAISTGERTLRALDRCNLLSQLVPELTRCRNFVPEEGLHTYTVMEHTFRVVRLLELPDPPPFLAEIRGSVTDLEALFLAALLHDVGKLDSEPEHPEYGAEHARNVCDRWGLPEPTADMAVWLVREHLTMGKFLRRDVMHPSTAEEFARVVSEVDRLQMLTLLTWADVNAVGPNNWTPAQERDLHDLYALTLQRLQGEMDEPPSATQSRLLLLRHLEKQPENETKIKAFLDHLPAHYLSRTSAEQVRLHMELAEKATSGSPTVEQFARPDLGGTEITVCALDQPGLLSMLLGALYAYDLSVIGIRASTTDTDKPVAIDVFTVSFGGRPVPSATLAYVSRALTDVSTRTKSVEEILHSRGKDPGRRPQFNSYTFVPGPPVILEIRAPRGRGMPYRFARLFAAHGWNILAARVGQWAGTAAATFYLTDSDGGPLGAEAVHQALSTEADPLD